MTDLAGECFRVWQEAEDVVGGLACLRCGTYDRPIVLAQHLKPGADIVDVPHGRNDAERRAGERSAKLGDQFLERVFLRFVRARQVAVKSRAVTTGMSESCSAVRCQLIGSK